MVLPHVYLIEGEARLDDEKLRTGDAAKASAPTNCVYALSNRRKSSSSTFRWITPASERGPKARPSKSAPAQLGPVRGSSG